jgi:hypothetical protein
MEKGSRRACSSSALSGSEKDDAKGEGCREVDGSRGGDQVQEPTEDDRHRVNDDGVSGSAWMDAWMVSLWNVVVAVSNGGWVTQRWS